MKNDFLNLMLEDVRSGETQVPFKPKSMLPFPSQVRSRLNVMFEGVEGHKEFQVWTAVKRNKDYEVSDLGDVKSLNYNHTGKPQVLKATKNDRGYLTIKLCNDGKRKTTKVHRLVAEAFLGEIPQGKEIDHLNTVKGDNRVENLRICTPKENRNNPITKERYRETNKISIKKAYTACMKPVVQYSKDGKLIATFPSTREAGRTLGIKNAQVNISACALGKQKSAYGYKWKFV